MKQWLMLKSERERHLILIATCSLIVAFIWFGILTPLNNLTDESRVQVNAQRNQLKWMTRQTQNLAIPGGTEIKKDRLSKAITTSASRLSLQLPKIIVSNQGAVLSFETVPYSVLVRWLEMLNKEHGIQVITITIEANVAQAGSVSVPQLILR